MLFALWMFLASLLPTPALLAERVEGVGTDLGLEIAALVERSREAPEPPEPLGRATQLWLQVDVVPDPGSAERLADRVGETLGAPAPSFVLVETLPGEDGLPPVHRVLAGPFDDYEAAEVARTRLEDGGLQAFVSPEDLDRLVGC